MAGFGDVLVPDPDPPRIAVVGERAAGVLAGSGRVGSPGGRHADLVLADTLDGASDLEVPVVALDESPPRLSVPAFDPETNNPVGWVRDADAGVAALGPLHLLPPGVEAERVAVPGEREVLGRVHHVEDVAAFHADVRRRTGTLAALAGRGVVVHVADPTPELEACLGAELFGQMVRDDIAGADAHRREAVSIRMRRAALREHSLRARARQVMGARALPAPPLPEVSVLLATKRPDFLPAALAGVAAQSYPRLELVLALHGEGFGDEVNALVAGMPFPVSVVRVPGKETMATLMNAASAAAGGLLLTKLDDDDHYGRDHVWDLVLAREYSRATLVGKGGEYVYLRRSNRTVHRFIGRGEGYGRGIAGGTFLISRHDLYAAGGWRWVPNAVDAALIEDVRRGRGRIYRTHGAGYLLVRHGSGHAWQAEEARFTAAPCEWRRGLDLAFAGIDIEPLQGGRSSPCARRVGISALSSSEPRPAAVRGNDWRQVEVPPLASFRPRRLVSVVVPYYEAPEALGLTLAALEGQTYPRELFEVVVVDDGSKRPLPASLATSLNARVVHQEDRGFGLARARNTGARAARHDILVFLDCDMMPEAEWLAAHARWHHVVSDALTLGSRAHVEVDGVDAAAIRRRKGTLADLFAGRPTTRPQWIEDRMRRTDDLTSIRPRDSGVVTGCVGVSRGFFEEVGAYDESFTEWGGEDTELGWRAFNLGGLLVPAREALCWHQGLGTAVTDPYRPKLKSSKVSHLMPFHRSRRARAGRSFTVPRHVVSIESGEAPVGAVLGSVERVLADRVHDLVVWVEERCDDFEFECLRRALEPDPRVYFGPAGGALAAFPAAAFQVTVPAGPAPEHLVHALETRLGTAVAAEARLATGARVALCRAWALHRARRSGKEVADFGSVLVLDPKQLAAPGAAGGKPGPVKSDARSGARPAPRRSGTEGGGVVARATYPLGAEIAVRGERAAGVLAGSGRVESSPGERHVDVVLADTLAGIDIEPLQGDRSSASARRVGISALSSSEPRPAAVRGNDWRQVEVPPLASFRPRRPVSVVVPYYEAPEALGLTLAALEGQTYPRELFEVVVVDDGSKRPLPARLATTLDARVVHQEDRGFGLARARNTGARAARHDILVFLDCDMMPEAEWLAAHARWHHVVSDALTLGFRKHVEVDGIDAAAIRRRKGALADLFAGRPVTRPEWIEGIMRRTDDLTSPHDDLSQAVTGSVGVSRAFFEEVGAYDESFTEWGGEDTELGWRAFNSGGLLVPAREALCWHQGAGTARTGATRHLMELTHAKLSHLIPSYSRRRARAGRSFTVPRYVVSIESGEASVERVLHSVERVLADRVHDLVVWVEERCDDFEFECLRRALEPDPRVCFGPAGGALDAFPAAAMHVTVPAGPAPKHLVHALETRLGAAVAAEARLATGARVALYRAWALHRARRSGKEMADFGDVLVLDPDPPRIAVVGERAAGVLAGSARVGSPGGRHADLVLADTHEGTLKLEVPVVALDESPPRLSVPAFDPETNNPVGWVRDAGAGVAALGALHLLPPGVGAERVAAPGERAVLGRVHHVEDVAAFHADVRRRAGTLAALAGRGVVVHVADPTPELEACLGAELFGQMVRDDIAGADAHRREAISIRMRRAALREHSLRARARQVMAASPLPAYPPPEVSVLLATKRPAFLPAALAGVATQSYPRLELVLALHGEGFGDEVAALTADLPLPVSVVRVPGDEPLGAVLNAATAAASGLLLTKLDDDDHYGRDHVWDLVLAHEYSRATLVGKGTEYVYLARSHQTVHRFIGRGERYTRYVAGGTFLISRHDLYAAGGWRWVPNAVDAALIEDVRRGRGRIYRTHGAGYLLVRQGSGHTWQAEDAYFLREATEFRPDLDPTFAGIDA